MVAYRRSANRAAAVVAMALVLGSSLVVASPRAVAAIPTMTLSLTVKPSWIEFGGTFTLTATITPSEPVTGLLRVAIFAEKALPAYGYMHGCTPTCSLEYPGLAEFEFDGLAGRTTVKAMWTDEGQTDEPTSNRFNVGISGGDVNVTNPPDPVIGYIGGPPPTATPKPTKRPTAPPTGRPPTAAPVVTAAPIPSLDVEPSTAIETLGSTPSAPPGTATPAPTPGSPPPTAPPAAEPAAASTALVIPIVALIVLVGVVIFALRRRRPTPGGP